MQSDSWFTPFQFHYGTIKSSKDSYKVFCYLDISIPLWYD